MEDDKLADYYDKMKASAPSGKRGGLGKGTYGGPSLERAGGNSLYSMFVKPGAKATNITTFSDSDDEDGGDKDEKKEDDNEESDKKKDKKKKKKDKKDKKDKKEKKKDKKDKKKGKKRKRSSDSTSSSASASSSTRVKKDKRKEKKEKKKKSKKDEPHVLSTRSPVSTSVHILRLLPHQDLLIELRTFAEKHNIRAGFVVTCVGSLEETKLRMANDPNTKSWKDPVEIVSLTGTVSSSGAHMHASVSLADGSVVGGHLMIGCRVRTTAEIVIGVAQGVTFKRIDDSRTGYDELSIEN